MNNNEHKYMRFLTSEERIGAKCFFCGTDKSVKYEVKVPATFLADVKKNTYCCNKCVLTHNDILL